MFISDTRAMGRVLDVVWYDEIATCPMLMAHTWRNMPYFKTNPTHQKKYRSNPPFREDSRAELCAKPKDSRYADTTRAQSTHMGNSLKGVTEFFSVVGERCLIIGLQVWSGLPRYVYLQGLGGSAIAYF